MTDSKEVGFPERFILAPIEPVYIAVRYAGHCRDQDRRLDLFRYCRIPESGNRVAVSGPALGAPAAALLVERLVRSGVKSVFLFSVCGSLVPELKIGDLFIPTGGISEEGTSRLYLKEPIPPVDPSGIKAVEAKCRAAGVTPQKGLIWTTDAPNRETPDKVARFRTQGAHAVDMEFTALSTLAQFHGIGFAALMVISDEIQKDKHRTGFHQKKFQDALKLGARIAVNAFSEA